MTTYVALALIGLVFLCGGIVALVIRDVTRGDDH